MELTDLQRQLAESGHLTLRVRCHPGAKKQKIGAVLADGSLKISVRAKAEDGRANEECLTLLRDTFLSTVELISGQTSRQKTVRLTRLP